MFEETDSGSDEVVLMKLLELAVLCLSCDASHLLTVSNAWEMYETCYMIGSDRRYVRPDCTMLLHRACTRHRHAHSLNCFLLWGCQVLEAHEEQGGDGSGTADAELV